MAMKNRRRRIQKSYARCRSVCVWLLLLMILLYAGVSEAQLPVLTAKELADLVEEREKRIERFQVRYEQTTGTVSTGAVSEILFKAPEIVNYSSVSEYAVDFTRNHTHFMDSMRTDNGDFVSEYAFDGKVYSSLQQSSPGEDTFTGGISTTKPTRLSEKLLLAVGMVGYRLGEGLPLADFIRNAREVKVDQAQIDGGYCYVVTLVATVPSVVLVDGEEKVGDKYVFYRFYLDPAHGMLPVRVDSLKKDFKSLAALAKGGEYLTESTAVDPRSIVCQRDIREIEPGVWFPFEVSAYSIIPDATPEVRHKCAVQSMRSVAVNDRAEVKSRVEFKMGSRITDEVLGVKYRVGMDAEMIDDSVLEVVANVRNPAELDNTEVGSINQGGGNNHGQQSDRDEGGRKRETSSAMVAGILFLVFVLGATIWTIAGRRKHV